MNTALTTATRSVRARLLFTLALLTSWRISFAAEQQDSNNSQIAQDAIIDTGHILQMGFSLLLVLAVIVIVGWIMRRMNIAQQSNGDLLRVLGGTAIGQRERVVLLQVKDTCLLVGIAPGQIRTLHTFPLPDDMDLESGIGNQKMNHKFATLLSGMMNKQKKESESS